MNYINSLIVSYQHRGLLVDTNLMLLLLVGLYDTQQIPKFKRTKEFTIENYETLARFVSAFKKVITTPNILTEVNSLSNQLSENLKHQYYNVFTQVISQFLEFYQPSVNLVSSAEFAKFGLTDSGIASLAKDTYLVLTDDFKLSNYLQSQKVDVINFNHLRTY